MKETLKFTEGKIFSLLIRFALPVLFTLFLPAKEQKKSGFDVIMQALELLMEKK